MVSASGNEAPVILSLVASGAEQAAPVLGSLLAFLLPGQFALFKSVAELEIELDGRGESLEVLFAGDFDRAEAG